MWGDLFRAHGGSIGTRPDERQPAGLAHFGEIGVFGKEAVAGMHCVGVGDFRGVITGRDSR